MDDEATARALSNEWRLMEGVTNPDDGKSIETAQLYVEAKLREALAAEGFATGLKPMDLVDEAINAGFLDADMRPVLKKLYGLRNKSAHKLTFILSEDDREALHALQPPAFWYAGRPTERKSSLNRALFNIAFEALRVTHYAQYPREQFIPTFWRWYYNQIPPEHRPKPNR